MRETMNSENFDVLFASEFEAIDLAQHQLTTDSVLRDEARQHRQRYEEGILNLAVQRAETELSRAYQRLGRTVAERRSSSKRSADAVEASGHPHEPAASDVYDAVNTMVYDHMQALVRLVDSGTSSVTLTDDIRTTRDEILKFFNQMVGHESPSDANGKLP